MGEKQSKPKKQDEMTEMKLLALMDKHPDVVRKYYRTRFDRIEKFVVEYCWEEDVSRWLEKIRKRSPKENLEVRKVDFMLKENAVLNKTEKFKNTSLVVRRDCHFDVDVYFGNRAFDPRRDDLTLVFGVGPNPSEATGTVITCFADNKKGDKDKWNCHILSNDQHLRKLSLRVNVPVSSIVARYTFSMDIMSGTQKGRVKTSHSDGSFVVLFNPFSSEDSVFMENKEEREEYVMNDRGFINVGTYRPSRRVGRKNWEFAQFEEGVLDSVLMMLQNDTRALKQPVKTLKKRSSPIFVSRMLAAMVNCNDDRGVLWGRWDGEYKDGKKPTTWNNSAAILLQWREQDLKPVKYGQCWVYSGILTTALRCLGIPARSVTNFWSAHDTDCNQTIDLYYDGESGEKMDATSDSIWNFHVWNEGYFRRPDLGEKYNGWQVVDATPQEMSQVADITRGQISSLMQCGPAPVKAVKEGEINVGLDTGFVFSEVNADKVMWFLTKDCKLMDKRVLTKAVGVYIGTKAVGKEETENIVRQYKYEEGSEKEREAFKRAYGLGTKDHSLGGIFDIESTLVPPAFEIEIENRNDPALGDEIKSVIKIKNVSGKKQSATLKIIATSRRHTGVTHAVLEKMRVPISMNPGAVMTRNFDLEPDDYMRSIVDDFAINITAIVSSNEDGNTSMAEDDMTLSPPECIEVQNAQYNPDTEVYSCDIVFMNKLSKKLTNGKFVIQFGQQVYTISASETYMPGQTYTIKDVQFESEYQLWPAHYGKATFESNEVSDVESSFRITTS